MRMLATAVLLLVASAGQAAAQFQNPELRARYQALTAELRCVICLNESIASSGAPLAEDMRQLVARQIRAGRSDEQIKQYLVERYGTFVLYEPPFSPATWLLWLGPAALLLVGLTVAAAMLRRKRRPAVAPEVDRERLARVLDETTRDEHRP